MKKFILVLFIICTNIFCINAHYVERFPTEITQPNGTIIKCYITGDEYYRRLHDENGFTIIENPTTSFYVYAVLGNDELLPSNYIVGEVDPFSVNLEPNIDISIEKKKEFSKNFWAQTPEKKELPGFSNPKSAKVGQNNGTLNNIVIYITFSDQSEFTTAPTFFENLFNKDEVGVSSMYRYFKELSNNKTFISSSFYPVRTGNTVISYKDTNPRSYYLPYSSSNTNGYTESQRAPREHALLMRAVNAVKNQVPTTLNLDNNNDGYVDNVCFIIRGNDSGNNGILWPHKWYLFSGTAMINGRVVWTYNVQLENHVNDASTLCHEMFHSLGAPDLYHYSYQGVEPAGRWDLMSNNINPPQSTNAYMKHKYGGWIQEIPEITQSGTYTLNNVWSETNNCYKIASPNSTGYNAEYFVVEYRDRSVFWDSNIPGSGLIIYRINPRYNGNADGPPDEIYLFRSGGTNTTTSGNLNNAHFSSNTGRTTFNNNSNPPCFLSNNGVADINISNVTATGTTISFDISFDPILTVSTNNIDFNDVSIANPSNPIAATVFGTYLTNNITYEVTGTDASFFSVTANPWSNTNGGTLSIVFSPDQIRSYEALLTISSEGVAPKTIDLTGTGIIDPMVAEFTSNTRTIFSGEEVQFFDESIGWPSSWTWTFEEGVVENPNVQNPIVRYNNPGTYQVKLYAANEHVNNEIVKDQYIIVESQNDNWNCNGGFEYWTGDKPNCWFGSKTNFAQTNATKVEEYALEGIYSIKFNNTYTNYKRFSSRSLNVDSLQTYEVSFFAKGSGRIFVGLYDGRSTNLGYAPNNSIIEINVESWTEYKQYVRALKSTEEAEFIFNIAKTVSALGHLQLDSVTITKVQPVIQNIDINESVQPISLCVGKTENDIIELLTPTIVIEDNYNQTYTVELNWTIPSFNGNAAGTYDAIGTFELPEGLAQSNPLTELNVIAAITLSDIEEIICPEDFMVNSNTITILESATPTGGIYSGQGVSENEFNSTGLIVGNYIITYTYTVPGTNCSNSCTFTIGVGVGVDENPYNNFSIYPNPSNGLLYINTEFDITIKIYSSIGTLIYEKSIDKNDFINLEKYPSGIYMINVTNKDGITLTKKIILE